MRKALAAELGGAEVTLVSAVEATLSSGEKIRLVDAVSPSRPNVAARLTFTDAGAIRPPAEVERLAGPRLFLPEFTPVVTTPSRTRLPVTVQPRTNDWRLSTCERATETVTVTIPKSGVAPKADVYLLADTTGSMGTILDAVKAGASAILNHPGLAGFDVAWGVGNYRDFPVGAGLNSYAFQHQLAPDTNDATVDAAISAWVAAEGLDTPEGQLYALHQIATDPATGWRPDAKRILVWFGDAPGHDPICADLSGLPADVTEASTTADLTGAGVTVVAVSTTSGADPAALDGDGSASSADYTCPDTGSAGQATRITAATGGSHTSGIDANDIVTTLGDLIAQAVASIGSVSLVPTGDAAEFVQSITPGSYGPLPGDEEHVLTFTVTWLGTKECREKDQVFTGSLDVVADGVVVAAKRVRVTVPACRSHYVVEMVCGQEREDTEGEDGRACHTVVPGRYATAVAIYNPSTCSVVIEKRFAALVRDGEVYGREPDLVDGELFARIKLDPYQATMDDCCALREVVGDSSGLVFGVLDIVSDKPIAVTAVHTADDPRSGPAITTRTIEPRRAP